MKFFACKNLVSQAVEPCEPWLWDKPPPSEKICKSKISRQEFYQSSKTDWCFYSCNEGANPNQRISKDNPVKYAHGAIADYDLPISDQRVAEAIESMTIRPAWVERSLGGNVRLIWTFPRPMAVETNDFAIFILQHAKGWLQLELLPGLDQAAWEDPARRYCRGTEWKSTGHENIKETALQAYYVEAAKKFKFKASEGNSIPLEIVEPALRTRFPGFSWPSGFDLDSQGPSFWVSGSVSPFSAIVKPDGMLTFSAHADKPFYSWSDILGADFVRETNEKAISRATLDIYHDGHNYWRVIDGIYQSVTDRGMSLYLKEGCGIPAKKVDATLHHINENNRVAGAAPFIFRPPGVITYNHRKVLNTWKNTVMQPANDAIPESLWVLDFLGAFLDPPEQLNWLLAWLQYFYQSAVELTPRPGTNVFIFGAPNRGKTFFSRMIVGAMVGGFSDASDYLVRGDNFGSENFHVPLWSVDDSNPGSSTNGHDKFASMLKKAAANQQHKYHAKFETPCVVEWAGRVLITANTDFTSSRILGSLDNNSADKTCVFRATGKSLVFPERYDLQKTLKTELPLFCRWLLDWKVPEHIPREGRYGFAPFHESTILDQTHQTSKAAPLKEIIIEELVAFFAATPEATEWRGTLSQLLRFMQANPLNDLILKGIRLEQMSRHLELIQREGILKVCTEVGAAKTRIWVFQRI